MGWKCMEYIKKLPRLWIKLCQPKCACMKYAKCNNVHKYFPVPSYENIKKKCGIPEGTRSQSEVCLFISADLTTITSPIEGHLTHSGYEFRFILGLNRLISQETERMHHLYLKSWTVNTRKHNKNGSMRTCEHQHHLKSHISINILGLQQRKLTKV